MGARRGTNRLFIVQESAVEEIATPITVDVDVARPHCFAGVQFFADDEGTIPATPGAGVVDIAIKTLNTEIFEESPGVSTIQGPTPTTISWAANTQQVRATPSGITVATHYKLVVTCNES